MHIESLVNVSPKTTSQFSTENKAFDMHIESFVRCPTNDYFRFSTNFSQRHTVKFYHLSDMMAALTVNCSESPLILNSRGEHSVHFKA